MSRMSLPPLGSMDVRGKIGYSAVIGIQANRVRPETCAWLVRWSGRQLDSSKSGGSRAESVEMSRWISMPFRGNRDIDATTGERKAGYGSIMVVRAEE
ncbi:MAG: hypothetical protein GEU90_09570 [Gemmatimonas sp.]|nr:hypothetical protein [Gemmatimonas sp.]